MNIYSWCVDDAVTDASRQFPKWVNQPIREEHVHRYWRNAVPPGSHPAPGNETYGVGSGLPLGMEKPLLVFERPRGALEFVDCLLLNRDLWLMSDKAKTILTSLDADAFEVCKATTTLHDGEDGPIYWVCDVVRMIDPVDESRSDVTITFHPSLLTGEPMRSASYSLAPDTTFKATVVGDFRIFRPLYFPSTVFCDEVVAHAIRDSHLTGLEPVLRGRTDR